MNLTEPVQQQPAPPADDRRRIVLLAVLILPLCSAVCSLAVLVMLLVALT